MMKRFSSAKFAIGLYIACVLSLFFYSFTQIDLSLTLSRASILQDIQKAFQSVGYFQRPFSTELYIFIITVLFISVIRLLTLIRLKQISLRTLIKLILFSTVMLTITYNAFSYDVFNYIFDAKIVTNYHENPYLKKALDYPQDPMLSFMRWTHRTYPYGPGWLALTVPVSYIGLQIFTVTFGLFKILMAASFLGTAYTLYRILKKVTPEYALVGVGFFALNPLVLVESLVSAHNDIVMLFFAVLGIFFLIRKQLLFAFVLLAISISIKYMTVLLLPFFVYVWYRSRQKKTIHWDTLFTAMTIMMIVGVAIATYRTNFQPWYLLYLLPFGSLVAYKKAVSLPLLFLSLTSLFTYVPYLFTGNWDPPIPTILLSLHSASWAIGGLLLLLGFRQDRQTS